MDERDVDLRCLAALLPQVVPHRGDPYLAAFLNELLVDPCPRDPLLGRRARTPLFQ